MNGLKEELYQYCRQYVAEKTHVIQAAIKDVQLAASEDTKSSAGDKYETGREMMQQEINMNLSRLNEIKKMEELLDHISADSKPVVVVPGSIIATTHGNYYIAISIGKITLQGEHYYIISMASPIGAALKGLKKGDTFIFNGKRSTIKEIS